jgi:outer membrane receptor protein involved in Fe transport
MTTNSNAIPVNGADRVEILRDGASAIYGADALAGVVNTVLKTDFVCARFRFKNSYYDD